MSESELATLGTYEASLDDTSDRSSTDSDIQSHIIMSDCENEQTDDGTIFMPQRSSSTVQTVTNAVAVSVKDQLIDAIDANDVTQVRSLLEDDPTLLEESGALHRAAGNNSWELCQLLITLGAPLDQKFGSQNATPIMWACIKGNAYIVKLLLDNGASLNVVDCNGFTPLHLAVHSSNILMVAYILHLEVDVDQLDNGRRSALHWACVQGDMFSVEALLKAGSSPNLPDGEGTLPLHLAVYTAKSEEIVKLLLQYGADPISFTSHASDLNISLPWLKGCSEAGRTPMGSYPSGSCLLSPELAKCITTISPAIVLPLAISILDIVPIRMWWLGIILTLFVLYIAKKLLSAYVIPRCWYGEKALLQSTLFAGTFCGLLWWDAYIYFNQVFPIVVKEQPIRAATLVVLLVLLIWSYLTTCLLDPGKIEPKSTAQRLRTMNELMDLGRFDSVHICVHTYVQKPFRSRYDHYIDRVVCRYDHYCPWTYNVVGLRNHRPFIIFLYTLLVIIFIAGEQYWRYCKVVGRPSLFSIAFVSLTGIQVVWLLVLTIVQTIQIATGVTSFELTNGGNLDLLGSDSSKSFVSLPRDHPRASEIFGENGSLANTSLRRNAVTSPHVYPIWMRVTGISQCLIILRNMQSKSSGVPGSSAVRNCADFWFTGESICHPQGGSGRIGGVKVDYYTLLDAQSLPRSESDRMIV